MAKIYIAGINGEQVSQEVTDLLRGSSDAVVCSEQYRLLLARYPGFNTKKWLNIVPVDDCLARIRGELEHGSVVVITSGDPLFYGLGKRLLKEFPASSLCFMPAISSMQICFARFAIPWDDAQVVSLHGRAVEELDRQGRWRKLFVFTDPTNTPDKIARYLRGKSEFREGAGYVVHVGERLCLPDERLFSGSLKETGEETFAQPNCMILVNKNPVSPYARSIGLKEEELYHTRGLITKNEVRAAVLHSLRLPEQGVLWDIGAGSGSISIESALNAPESSVFAIEKNGIERENINKNKVRYQCSNVSVIAAEAPHGLSDLPIPDRVFIGGSGGRLEAIIRAVVQAAHEQTIIVLTAVTERTASEAPRLLYKHGYRPGISLIQTTRYQYPEQQETILNPIYLIVAKRNNA